jgi:hypothetical protein
MTADQPPVKLRVRVPRRYTVGDRDPFTGEKAMPCAAALHTGDTKRPTVTWLCTRSTEHAGPHVAGSVDGFILATWR